MLFIMLAAAYPFGRPEDEQLKPSKKMHVMLQVEPTSGLHVYKSCTLVVLAASVSQLTNFVVHLCPCMQESTIVVSSELQHPGYSCISWYSFAAEDPKCGVQPSSKGECLAGMQGPALQIVGGGP